jgi:hypothetical protein
MPTCIYCRQCGNLPFPKEHVVPQAFGRFLDNLTLDCVCGGCNSFFNHELEIFLTRDSVEALLRIRHGLKTKTPRRRKLGESRLVIRVISPGDWYGARLLVERGTDDTPLRGEPLPQVGFRKLDETKRQWFLENELDDLHAWERYRTSTETHIVGKPESAALRLIDKLQRMGITFKERHEPTTHGGLIQVHADAALDDIIFRGAAKIAFNFLAYVKGPDFALRAEFDEMRDYIRTGVATSHPQVIVSTAPILNSDDALYRQTRGHLVILDWDRNNSAILCLLSLFNHLTYHVVLCRSYSGIWHPLATGRHFDLETRRITNVHGIDRRLLL